MCKCSWKMLLVSVLVFVLSAAAFGGLSGDIAAVIGRDSQKKCQFAIKIVKVDTGKTVYSRDANKAMVPASNMKLVTSAAALDLLGAGFEYETVVGISDGSLVIKGAGDPLLGDATTDEKYGRGAGWIFKEIAAAVKAAGVAKIKDIVVDSSVFDDERVHPSWPKKDLNRWYACEISGLNWRGNCIDVTVKNRDGRISVITEPATSYIKITNKVKAISKGKGSAGSYRLGGMNEITVFGKCKKEVGPFEVAIERPAGFFAFLLAEELGRSGVAVEGKFIEKQLAADVDVKVLGRFKTKFADVLARCNKDSFALAAESVLKTAAAKANGSGRGGSWQGGAEVMAKYLARLGVDKLEFHIDDGCGLSRENKLSTNSLTKVLLGMYKSDDWEVFKKSLAVGGVDGTVGKYFKDAKYKGKVFGKTGYIAKVRSFSGVCETSSGDYVFSIITYGGNGHTRKAINDIVEAVIDN